MSDSFVARTLRNYCKENCIDTAIFVQSSQCSPVSSGSNRRNVISRVFMCSIIRHIIGHENLSLQRMCIRLSIFFERDGVSWKISLQQFARRAFLFGSRVYSINKKGCWAYICVIALFTYVYRNTYRWANNKIPLLASICVCDDPLRRSMCSWLCAIIQ